MNKLIILVSLSFSVFFKLSSQTPYPQDYFAQPVKGQITLAGNFGEARPNHLHSGFDVRTGGRVGVPIYAVADGYVSRINIKPTGYGNALYINHPNGYTSVYAHLSRFIPTIDSAAKQIQYADESFVIDTLIDSTWLPVKKGQLIAYSGNTGGSSGPHLHFEIRETQSEMPVNPYLFGYNVKDDVKPVIGYLAIYPMNDSTSINGKNRAKRLKTYKVGKEYVISKLDTLTINGSVGFGIQSFDRETGPYGKNAVYSLELLAGGKQVFYAEYDKFSFDKSRYVNTQIDYATKQKKSIKIHKCFLSKNNQLGVNKEYVDRGILTVNDSLDHWINLIVKDFAGNESKLVFKVKGTKKSIAPLAAKEIPDSLHFNCLKENVFSSDWASLRIPAFALYDDIDLVAQKTTKQWGTYAPMCRFQSWLTPLNDYCELKIKTINVPERLTDKLVVVQVLGKGKKRSKGGVFENGWMTTKIKNFGKFTVMADTTAPVIKSYIKISDSSNVNLSAVKRIRFRITDNLSGINTYRGTIDGKWVLFTYDKKKKMLTYEFDKPLPPGKHELKMVVTDNTNNSRTWLINFTR